MQHLFTAFRRRLLLALALGGGATAAQAQTYTPVALTGFTQDIIANGPGRVDATTTADIDSSNPTGGTGYTLMAQDYVGPTGQVPNTTTYPAATYPALETNGLITSVLNSDVKYQLASYSANNALRLVGAAATGTLSFATPSPAAELLVLGTSGSAESALDITVNFAGGTSQTFTNQALPDWFATGKTNVVREKLGRASRADNAVQYTGSPVGPRLYQLRLPLDAANVTKNITGIAFSKPLAAGNAMLLAVTAVTMPVCAAVPSGLSAAATTTSGGTTALTTACSSTSIFLSLSGLPTPAQAGYAYQWQSSTNGGTTWTDIAGATSSTYTATGQLVATSYRVLVTCLYAGTGTTAVPSTAVQVAQTAFDACYCTPTSSSGCATYAQLLKVEIPGTGLLNTTTCAGTPFYTNVSPAVATATLSPGTSYPLSITLGRYAKAGLWVDFDHSGTFDASEYLVVGSNSTNTAGSTATVTPTLVIPSTALSGPTRMRVRTQYFLASTSYPLDATTSCGSTIYGETEDYTITIAPSLACTGTPPAITAGSSATTTCSATAFTLSANGAVPGTSGLTYQWQSAPAGTSTFTNLGTASATSFYTVANQTVATDYRVVVTCTASGQSATSNVVSVAQSPFLNCYCTPTYSSGGAGDNVVRVQLGVLDNATTGNASPYYRDYSAQQTGTAPTVPTPAIFPGTSAAVTLTFGTDGNQHGAVWIDFNQNGILGDVANEFVATTASAGANGVVTLTLPVPTGAALGLTKMRIRGGDDTNDPTLGQACGASGSAFGEAEDYLVNVVAPVPCTGTPPATVATTSATTACATAAFNLNVTGITPGTTGLTYQWQSAPAGTTTFTNLGTAQATPGYTVASQPASMDYRVVITCTASGVSTTSSVIAVTRTYLNCYCAVVSTGTNEYIKRVALPGVNGFANATNANSASGYGDFTANTPLTTTLNQGASYVGGASVTVRSNNTNSTGGFWIDYDHSGTFDASEFTLLGVSSLIAKDTTFTVTLAIPATAQLGQTRMRVRWRNGTFTSADACITGTTTWYGETEDYLVTIAAPTTCSGAPATVTATADVTNACANAAFTLSTTSVPTTLGGYTYQWQSRTGTNAFADIVGATTNPYTIASQTVATDYQLVVSCQYGGTPVTSNIVAVGQNGFAQCYCAASSTNVCSNYGVITNVSLGTISNATGCTSATSYSSYATATTPTTTTSLTPGATETLTLGVASATTAFSYHYGVWIDFNHNGTFDASEFVAHSTTAVSATNLTVSLPIPATSATVLLGDTRMRIRTNASQYGVFTAAGACGAIYNGETEDYLVTLAACTPTAANFSYGNATYCVSGTTSPAVTLATGATAGAFSSTNGLTLNATTGAITLSSSNPGVYTITNSVGGTSPCASSATATVTITAAPLAGFTLPTAPLCAGTTATLPATLAAGATAGTYSLPAATGLSVNASTGAVTVGATAPAGTYTVTNTLAAANGCAPATATATFTIAPVTTATFAYSGSPYCLNGSNPTPSITGTAGGAFSAPTGLNINATTGVINLSGSTVGTYTVTYNVSGACGSSSTQQVVVNAAPAAGFAFATPAPGTACVGSTSTFAPTMASGATAGTFTATPAGLNLNATTGAINLANSTAGTYTITNTVSGVCAATSTSSFTVNAAPAVPTITVSGTPTTGITLTSSVATGNQWSLGGTAVPGATGATYFINSGTRNGSYTVTTTNAAGCSSTSAATAVAVLGTRATVGTALTLYPNPTRDGSLTLELSGYREAVTLSVTNTLGQRVYEGTVSGAALGQPQKLNLSALPSGVYVLQARTASGGVDVRRIVRE